MVTTKGGPDGRRQATVRPRPPHRSRRVSERLTIGAARRVGQQGPRISWKAGNAGSAHAQDQWVIVPKVTSGHQIDCQAIPCPGSVAETM